MAVIAKSVYEIGPGRFEDFLLKSGEAADPKFTGPIMPTFVRLFRCTVPGPDTQRIILHIDYEYMATYGSRTSFENGNEEWRKLLASTPDSPEQLISIELLSGL